MGWISALEGLLEGVCSNDARLEGGGEPHIAELALERLLARVDALVRSLRTALLEPHIADSHGSLHSMDWFPLSSL